MGYAKIPKEYDYDRGVIKVDRIQVIGMFMWIFLLTTMLVRFWVEDYLSSIFIGMIVSGGMTMFYDGYYANLEMDGIRKEQEYLFQQFKERPPLPIPNDDEEEDDGVQQPMVSGWRRTGSRLQRS